MTHNPLRALHSLTWFQSVASTNEDSIQNLWQRWDQKNGNMHGHDHKYGDDGKRVFMSGPRDCVHDDVFHI